jgi:hypothetical protein
MPHEIILLARQHRRQAVDRHDDHRERMVYDAERLDGHRGLDKVVSEAAEPAEKRAGVIDSIRPFSITRHRVVSPREELVDRRDLAEGPQDRRVGKIASAGVARPRESNGARMRQRHVWRFIAHGSMGISDMLTEVAT